MSCGIPVVATAVGGTKEILRDGIDGFVVPPHEPLRLADQLLKLLQDPRRHTEMGINARQRIEADFSSDVFYRKILELYKELLQPTTSTHSKGAQESDSLDVSLFR
jgi:glycosyltransferase involved in cell wall biosynthesis